MIDQSLGIDTFEGAFDEVRRLVAEFAVQLFRLLLECAADGMNETHYRMQIIVPSIVAMSSRRPSWSTPNTSARTTVNVLPALTTSATAKNVSPFAGRRRLTLNSTLRTSDSAGIKLYAA